MQSNTVDEETYEEVKSDTVALVEKTVPQADLGRRNVAEVGQNLDDWLHSDDLPFGKGAVWHSLEDAGVPREDRFAIVDMITRKYDIGD